ncbi:hypothetical protein ACSQ67_002137 [Phaseolus vulgaris]
MASPTSASPCSATTTTTTLYFNTPENCKVSKKEGSSSSTTSPLINNSSTQRKCAFARKCARLAQTLTMASQASEQHMNSHSLGHELT